MLNTVRRMRVLLRQTAYDRGFNQAQISIWGGRSHLHYPVENALDQSHCSRDDEYDEQDDDDPESNSPEDHPGDCQHYYDYADELESRRYCR